MNCSQRKRKTSGSSVLQADPTSKKRVDKLFQKKFSYSPNSNKSTWETPTLNIDRQSDVWQITDPQQMKSKLNALKDKLSDKDISLWHQHTGQMNLAGTILSEVRQNIRPELCTQAWCKFYEILSTFGLVDLESPIINSVHLCEAPGAFITSLNHFLISHDYRGMWTWFGNTLSPYYEGNNVGEMVADDRFILHSLPYWHFGADGTGNLMDWNNFQQVTAICHKMTPVYLVTCDGSIDCQDTPGDQETVVSRLHCCEAFAAMTILSPGGTLVVKKFTMFECETVCLMYLLNCVFNQVHVFKPTTSKSGNSEVYIICMGFHGNSGIGGFTDYVKHYFENGDKQLIFDRSCIPDAFIAEHMACCEMFTSLQMETIRNNLDHYPSISDQYTLWLDTMRDYCAEMYFTKFNVKKIPLNGRVGQYSKKRKSNHSVQSFKHDVTPFDQKRHTGTFTDRYNSSRLPWPQKVHQMEKYTVKPAKVIWCQFETYLEGVGDEELSWGKPVSSIVSSRFCDGKLIQQMQDLMQNAKNYTDATQTSPLSPVSRVLDILSDGGVESEFTKDKRSEVRPGRSDYTVVLLSTVPRESPVVDWTDRRISKVLPMASSDIQSPGDGTTGDVVYYVDVTVDTYCGEMEILSQDSFLSWIQTLLLKLKMTDTLMVRMSSCLTRFTAGLVYMVGHCFAKIGILRDVDGTSFQQTLICDDYTGSPAWVLQQLEAIRTNMTDTKNDNVIQMCPLDSINQMTERQSITKECGGGTRSISQNILMETVPLQPLLNDSLFVATLCHSNAILLRAFIKCVGDLERERYPKEKQSDISGGQINVS